jgi:hypothetical protein
MNGRQTLLGGSQPVVPVTRFLMASFAVVAMALRPFHRSGSAVLIPRATSRARQPVPSIAHNHHQPKQGQRQQANRVGAGCEHERETGEGGKFLAVRLDRLLLAANAFVNSLDAEFMKWLNLLRGGGVADRGVEPQPRARRAEPCQQALAGGSRTETSAAFWRFEGVLHRPVSRHAARDMEVHDSKRHDEYRAIRRRRRLRRRSTCAPLQYRRRASPRAK